MSTTSKGQSQYSYTDKTSNCIHCRARSHSSSIMESSRTHSTRLSSSSSSLPSMAASCTSSPESEGYFSFQSVGLLEPEEYPQRGQQQQVESSSTDYKYKDGRSRGSQRSRSSKKHVGHASRSNSLSRLFSAFSSTSPISSVNRSRAAHPFSSSSISNSNVRRPTTPVIFEVTPKRPSLLDTIKTTSDPYIDIERMKCERPHKSYYEKRCEMGFIVNAETSLRDVL